MLIDALQTLYEVRSAAERQAEQQLARAAALLAREQDRGTRLAAELDAARAGRERVRADSSLTPGSAAALQRAHRYATRLDADLQAAAAALEVHARGPLAAATAALDRARADHLRSRQRREAVERAIARRQAARRREQDRRAEAALDDLPQRRR
jgi:flagellar export protein FliJ